MKHFRLFRFFVLFALIFNGISCSEQLEVDPDVALNMNEANIAGACLRGNQPTGIYAVKCYSRLGKAKNDG